MTLDFTKVEGLGNDFVLIDLRDLQSPPTLEALREWAPKICNRRRGVGADGILVVTAHDHARAQMLVVNHDGSRPEMCGNGLRCVAQYVATTSNEDFEVATDAGLLRCWMHMHTHQQGEVEIDMGPATHQGIVELASCPAYPFHKVSIGNPHAITFVSGTDNLTSLATNHGPTVEHDPEFPQRTNVEFARVKHVGSTTRIELAVWERGCGLTQACGTGACATAFAAVHAGLAEPYRDIDVQLPGGSLRIRVPRSGEQGVRMTGPARQVFRGSLSI